MFNFFKARLISLCSLVIFICTLILPVASFALDPLDAYREYLPEKMPIVKRHLRAAWIASVTNLDWPSATSRYTSDESKRIAMQKKELTDKLDKAAQLNINAVFFQVRPEADALYRSELVPWSRYLTSAFGKDPGFDPLAFAIEEAHKRNIELHAWFNPYRVTLNTNESTISSLNISKSVYKEHPEWVKTAGNRFVVDPGIPEARYWVEACVMEVVKKYDVDGIHFDDYFYYDSSDSRLQDDDTYAKYNNGQFSNKGDWRRNNTYLLVKELSQKIRAEKPWVKFGISPAGVWGDKSKHPDGSNTYAGYTNYDVNFADTKKWVEEEIIDYIAPQVYWSFSTPSAPYGEVSSWWANLVRGKNVHLYIGQPFYKVNDSNYPDFSNGNGEAEISRQLIFNAAKPEIAGSALFSFNRLYDANKSLITKKIQTELWATKALVPVMPWKGGRAPATPVAGASLKTENGVKLSWTDNDSRTSYFVIYRFNSNETVDLSSDSSAGKIIATVRKAANGSQEYIDTTLGINSATYAVTALDRLHNESPGLKILFSQDPLRSKYFFDVGNMPWAVEAMDSLYEQGIVLGVGDGYFLPEARVKRADFMLMLVRALKLQAPAGTAANFTDVTTDKYYYEAVKTAKALGIALGNGDGTFSPESEITRQDLSVLVYRALELVGRPLPAVPYTRLSVFSDKSLISSYAKTAVARLTDAWLANGTGSSFRPGEAANRAETAALIYRAMN